MEASVQYFPGVQFIMLHKWFLPCIKWMKS